MQKIKTYLLEILLIILLLFIFFSKNTITRNKISIFIFCYMLITSLILKKRLFVNQKKALHIIILLAISYLAIFYFFGIFSGFRKSKILLSVNSILTIILPLIVIIISSEIIRNIFLAQKEIIMNKNISKIFIFFKIFIFW